MTDEWTVQVSPKIGDTLINVRGASVQEVTETFADLADVYGKVVDSIDVIGAAQRASTAMNTPAPTQPAPANWTPPAQPAAASPGNAPTCGHNVPMNFKETKTGKKLWECHLATANWKDPNACKSKWIN
jgi:hypothetical protein